MTHRHLQACLHLPGELHLLALLIHRRLLGHDLPLNQDGIQPCHCHRLLQVLHLDRHALRAPAEILPVDLSLYSPRPHDGHPQAVSLRWARYHQLPPIGWTRIVQSLKLRSRKVSAKCHLPGPPASLLKETLLAKCLLRRYPAPTLF